jgi:ADP-ribose pyrophosphatase YjhB (NUDIX family)
MSRVEDISKVVEDLRAIASWGLHFSQDPHDIKRYKQVRAAAARLAAASEQRPPDEVQAEFERDLFNPAGVSPLATADAVVVRDNRILLIRRADDGLWALPGGFVQINQTLAEAALRELQEETGLCGRIIKLLGIFDSRLWGSLPTAHIHHTVFLVDGGSDAPRPTPEATEVAFFSEANLPDLSRGHHMRVPFVFKLLREELPVPYLDPAGEIPGCE